MRRPECSMILADSAHANFDRATSAATGCTWLPPAQPQAREKGEIWIEKYLIRVKDPSSRCAVELELIVVNTANLNKPQQSEVEPYILSWLGAGRPLSTRRKRSVSKGAHMAGMGLVYCGILPEASGFIICWQKV
ncbi:hypothetical protein FA15DRAFT_4649 [Coprinopsis marcescibilis]|uniref:Uncharacterized protein n=1 Tax=Coprinopsis marcescibilis TaxID=230819 RepID=A0A5C3LBF4_COPMA|nr:hypothetical protein FA15DRAFT_4649 [Coprinopsis marcescibilis]